MSTFLVYSREGPRRWVLHGVALSEPPADEIRQAVATAHPTRPTAVIEDRTGKAPDKIDGVMIHALGGGASSNHPPLDMPSGWTWNGGQS